MKPHQINGLLIIILGIGMLIFGSYMFSYQGKNLNPDISKLGMLSFFLWLPTIIVGIVVMVKKAILTFASTHISLSVLY